MPPARAVKENEATQSLNDIDDFENRLAHGVPRQPAAKKAPVPPPQRRPQQSTAPKGKDYVQSSKAAAQRPRVTAAKEEEDDFEDAKKAVSDLDKFDALDDDDD